MTREEAEHSLSVLIELDLYKRIKATKEGKFPNEKEMIESIINGYESKLPEWTEPIPNVHIFILNKIASLEKSEKKLAQNKFNKNNNFER